MRPPSVTRRAIVALSMLCAFVATTLGVSLLLFAIPIAHFSAAGAESFGRSQPLLLFAFTWIPAALLLKGLFDARPPRFVPPGRRLRRREAPALFALLDTLARRARTAPPREVYLSPLPNVGVLETGGFVGIRSRRVLVLGLPIVDWLSVRELRAVLAHELGHYLGGDTRLCGVLGWVEASFRAVLLAVRRSPGSSHAYVAGGREIAHLLGGAIVRFYARLFFRWTRADGRRQEIAADALAASVAGREAAIRALESVAALSPLYLAYVESDVASAVDAAAVPSDVMRGFCTFRERCRERDVERQLLEDLRAQRTDPFDTHPALAERVAALRALDVGGDDDATTEDATEDERSARHLFADPESVERWLVDALLEHASTHAPVRAMPWSEIGREAYTSAAKREAKRMAIALRPVFPRTRRLRRLFAKVVDAVERGDAAKIVHAIDPAFSRVPPSQQGAYAGALLLRAIATLFQGALVEAGAVALPSIGEGCCVFELDGERVMAVRLAADAMKDASAREAVRAWAARLEGTIRRAS